MHWLSWSEFFRMGGYALYVWPAFAFTLLCVLWECLALRARRAQALRLAALLAQE